MTIPASEITPRKAMNPKGTWNIRSPITMPMTPRGIVRTIMVIFLKELN